MGEHKYILCEEEKDEAMPLKELLKSKSIEATEGSRLPGHTEKLFAADSVKSILRKLAKSFYGLHKYCHKTVKSKFKMDNIWVTSDGDVKLKDVELYTATRSRVNTTYKRLAKLLRKNMFNLDLPLDIQQWLEIMESKLQDAYDMQYLIKCHPSIMADRNKLEFLIKTYKHLWPMKVKLRRVHDELLDDLPYANDWKSIVQENDFLSDIYNYEDKYGNKVEYEDKIPGLMQFLKNSDSHLHEKALPQNVAKPLFQSWHLAPITFETIPLFIRALAKRMHQNNELRVLQVEDLMASREYSSEGSVRLSLMMNDLSD